MTRNDAGQGDHGGPVDEEALVDRIARGDDADSAMNELVASWQGPAFRYAFSLLRDEQYAEDVVQETFTVLYQKANLFNPAKGSSAAAYFFRIVRNQAWALHRKKGRRMELFPDEEPVVCPVTEDLGFDIEQVRQAVTQFNERDRLLYELLEFGLNSKEIAQIMDCEQSDVGKRKHRLIEKIKKVLHQREILFAESAYQKFQVWQTQNAHEPQAVKTYLQATSTSQCQLYDYLTQGKTILEISQIQGKSEESIGEQTNQLTKGLRRKFPR